MKPFMHEEGFFANLWIAGKRSGCELFFRRWIVMIAIPFFLFGSFATENHQSFDLRGYYLTFMRMPVMGLPEWKAAVDCFAEDKANVLILWMAGGFRSRKYPITWKYNEEHANVRADFARELIDYAHTKKSACSSASLLSATTVLTGLLWSGPN
jgi:hypothetical protein